MDSRSQDKIVEVNMHSLMANCAEILYIENLAAFVQGTIIFSLMFLNLTARRFMPIGLTALSLFYSYHITFCNNKRSSKKYCMFI